MQLMAEVLFQKRAQKQAHHCYLTQNQRTAEKPARGHCTGCTEGQSRLPGAGKTQQAWWSFAAGDYRLAGRGRIRAHLKLKPTIWNRVKTFFTSRTQLKQMLYAPGWWTHTHTHTHTNHYPFRAFQMVLRQPISFDMAALEVLTPHWHLILLPRRGDAVHAFKPSTVHQSQRTWCLTLR